MKNVASMTITKRADQILYTYEQYRQLIKAAVATSSISLISSFLIAIAFIYLQLKHPERANRISLRCVFCASIMNLIYNVFNLGIMLTYGDTVFCKVSSIVNLFSQTMSGAFLTLVGINLVLVFVLNVHYTARQLERFYYPGAFIYGLVAISVPISQIYDDGYSDQNYRCYYFVSYYQVFGHTNIFWMWHYGFIFLSIVIATGCSIIALVKLVHEHNNLISRFIHIASTSETADTANSNIQQRIKSQSNIFTKVVSRCIIYPLVPLICNIWGFVFQLILANPNVNPKYALSMMSTIFTCLQGFFVALVFFSDPAMSHFITERWIFCKQKYIDDFSEVRRYSDGQVEIIRIKKKLSDDTTARPDPVHFSPRVYYQHDKLTCIEDIQDIQIEERRLSIPQSVYLRMANATPPDGEQTPASTLVESSGCQPCQCITDPDSQKKILVPYKYPRLASVIHWILVKCGVHTQKNNDNQVQFLSLAHEQSSFESVNIHPTSSVY